MMIARPRRGPLGALPSLKTAPPSGGALRESNRGLSGVYAVGGSMGGQETLLLLARDPHLLAGAIAFDAVVNLAFQYRNFPRIPCADKCRRVFEHGYGLHLQQLARKEIGGSPASDPRGYELRSPLDVARRIAFSGVPLELWWSRADLIARDQQAEQSGRLFRAITRLNPEAPVEAFVGSWIHTHEMRASTRLPFALANLDLLPEHFEMRPHHLHYVAPPAGWPADTAPKERKRF